MSLLRRALHQLRLRFAARSASRKQRGSILVMTLLGIGSFPASHPLNLGMMGMHGEAWVNTAIQESDLLIALGMASYALAAVLLKAVRLSDLKALSRQR
mgnify:CR=1 FL=1